jgi:hypothetical protein
MNSGKIDLKRCKRITKNISQTDDEISPRYMR